MAVVTWLEFGYPVNGRLEARPQFVFTEDTCAGCEDQGVDDGSNEFTLKQQSIGYKPDGSRADPSWVLQCTNGDCQAQYWPEAVYE